MEENVALDSNKQKKFVKSLKGIKKLMKKTGAITEKPEKENKPIKEGKVIKRKRKVRGLVYLSHIPHGFYEHQMTQYFKQFGVVTNARVIRSKHTGRSKGHAFVEFKDTTVAQIVADTMNNYLMGKRLIKAVYIPPKDQRKNARRKNWNAQNNLGNKIRLNMKKSYNADKSENEDLKIANKLLINLANTKKKLKELDIDYDFFTPVDVPEGLADKVIVKEENEEDKKDIIIKPKKNKKVAKESSENKDNKIIAEIRESKNKEKNKKKQRKQKKLNKTNDASAQINAQVKDAEIKESNINTVKAKKATNDKNNKNKKENVLAMKVNKIQQEQKQQKFKESAVVVKPHEDFIKLGEEDEDSDSSYQFDSDEYESMMNNEDDSVGSNTDGEDSNDENIDISERKEMIEKTIKNKGKKLAVQSKLPIKQELKQQQIKRKGSAKVAVQSKKPKFEKQSNKSFAISK